MSGANRLPDLKGLMVVAQEVDKAADALAAKDAMALRYCQLTEATRQLQANVKALHDNKCIFFSYCWREVCCPLLHQCQLLHLSVYQLCSPLRITGEEAALNDRPLSY